jgi:predicted esterase
MLAIALALLVQDAPKTGTPYAVDVEKPQTRYWCQLPEGYAPERSWPVMVILHGAGDTAENFVKFWSAGGSKAGFILAAAKSRGQAWDDSDGDVILAVLEDVKKKHRVDPDRVLLLGYSSGGFMATRWGFKNASHWRVITAIAGAEPGGGKEYKAAQQRGMTVLVECGERDPNLGICKQVFDKVKKDGFDCDSWWVPKMEHSPLLPEAAEWVFAQILKRLNAPAEAMKRAKRASAEKRWGDAIAEYKAVPADDKGSKSAAAELAKLEKAANDKLAEAQKKMEKGDKAGAKKLLEEVVKYAGLEAAEKAAEALKELRR